MALSKTRVRVVKAQFAVTVAATPAATKKAFQTVASEMQEVIREKLSTPSPPRSVVGQPPGKDTGYLHDETTVKAEGKTIKVRTPQYGIWLEEGAGNLGGPRPWLRSSIHAKPKYWAKRLNMHAKREMVKAAKLKKAKPRRR